MGYSLTKQKFFSKKRRTAPNNTVSFSTIIEKTFISSTGSKIIIDELTLRTRKNGFHYRKTSKNQNLEKMFPKIFSTNTFLKIFGESH